MLDAVLNVALIALKWAEFPCSHVSPEYTHNSLYKNIFTMKMEVVLSSHLRCSHNLRCINTQWNQDFLGSQPGKNGKNEII